jgi:hypothetical protein
MEVIKVYTSDNDPIKSVLLKLSKTDIKKLKHILVCKNNEPPEIFSSLARDTILELTSAIINETEKSNEVGYGDVDERALCEGYLTNF